VRPLRLIGAALVSFAVLAVTATSAAADVKPILPWNLDRIDQRILPLDRVYTAPRLDGAGIDIYILDTDVRATHEQLAGRAVNLADFSIGEKGENTGSTCDGHGTHVSSIAAGNTVGVARGSRLLSVQVLDCDGNGEVPNVVEGIERVIDHHTSGRLAIANLSLGVDIGDDGDSINAAIRRLIADGVVVIVAAGNGNSAGRPIDACMIAPANEPQAITVGAVDWNDKQSSYSNFGSCIDIYAPGGDFNSWVDAAWNASDTDYYGDAGTSMASPHVAGLAALLAQQQPGLCPQSVERAILARATTDVLVGLGAGSPNRMLYLDTSPITEITTPGTPTNVVAVADNSSLTVSWDHPCDGGTQIEKSIVSVYSGARLVKKMSVAGTRHVVRVGGLRNGSKYTATVRTQSLAGRGGVSAKSAQIAPRRLSVGASVPVTSLMSKPRAGSARWVVAPQSSAVCAIKPGPQRLVGLKRGKCVVSLTTSHAETSRTHVLTIG